MPILLSTYSLYCFFYHTISGFAAYVGFIHVECAHTHPVLIVFLRLLLIRQKYKALQKEKDTNAMEKGRINVRIQRGDRGS